MKLKQTKARVRERKKASIVPRQANQAHTSTPTSFKKEREHKQPTNLVLYFPPKASTSLRRSCCPPTPVILSQILHIFPNSSAKIQKSQIPTIPYLFSSNYLFIKTIFTLYYMVFFFFAIYFYIFSQI